MAMNPLIPLQWQPPQIMDGNGLHRLLGNMQQSEQIKNAPIQRELMQAQTQGLQQQNTAQQRDLDAQGMQYLHNAAKTLRNIPDPAQRQSVFGLLQPQLRQLGMGDDDLAFDVTNDQELDGVITSLGSLFPQTVGKVTRTVTTADGVMGVREDGSLVKLGDAPQSTTATTLMKNAEAMGLQPGTPEYADFIMQGTLKPSTQVTVNNAGTEAEKKELAKIRAQDFKTVQTAANNAIEMNERLGQLENMDVNEGLAAPAIAAIARVFNAAGVDGDRLLDTNVASMQSFNAVSGQLLAEALQAQTGPQTDNDADRIRATLPQISNEGLANKFIISSLRAVNERKIEQARFWDEYLAEKDTLKGVEAEWRRFKMSTPMVSANVKNKATGLPIFFYEFRERLKRDSPGASDQAILEKWREVQGAK